MSQYIKRKLLKNFESDTGFEVICCSCNQWKSRNQCSKISKLTEDQQNEYLELDEGFNMSKDKKYYVCDYCIRKIKTGKAPKKGEKDFFHVADFPQSLKDQIKQSCKINDVATQNMKNLGVEDPEKVRERYEHDAVKLNKLESFILKIVIPFVRVAHCKRSPYLMVKGNLILISNDIEHSMSKILPVDQQLLPVAFKRKLQYRGSYLEEFIDVEKIKKYFQWFKKHNPHFKDIELSEELIQHFEKEALDGASEFENAATSSSQNEEQIAKEVTDELLSSDSEDSITEQEQTPFIFEKNIKMDHTSMFSNKYQTDINLPTVANRMADLIIEYEAKHRIVENVEDEVEAEYLDPDSDDMDESTANEFEEEEIYRSDEESTADVSSKNYFEEDEIFQSEDESMEPSNIFDQAFCSETTFSDTSPATKKIRLQDEELKKMETKQPEIVECNVCFTIFYNQEDLNNHVMKEHQENEPNEKTTDEYRTQSMSFDDDLPDLPFTSRSREPAFSCSKCDFVAFSKSDLKNHIMAEHESTKSCPGPKRKQLTSQTVKMFKEPNDHDSSEVSRKAKRRVKKIKDRMEKIQIAPGEFGKFQNWGNDTWLEEKCFPHLYPMGVGGYLSSNIENKDPIQGFAKYVRGRIMSADSKFRQDYIYLFFLLLVKELIQLKRCKTTYLRQARKLPNLKKEDVLNVQKDNLPRFNRSYEVFKTMRGTSMYYGNAKKNLMTMLRQKGCPSLFMTISCAEYQWKELVRQILETEWNQEVTMEYVDSLSDSQRNQIISRSAVQSTAHFQRRIEKIFNLLKYEDIFPGFTVPDYYYRIEFQAR